MSWVVAFAVFVAFALAMEAVGRTIDRARFPWGYPDSGHPALAGMWVGTLVTASGQRLGMLMDIELAPLDRGRRRPPLFRTRRSHWLEGRVWVCTIPGGIRRLKASGKPDDTNTASTFHLGTSPADSVAAPDGLSPSTIKGRWGGGDTVDLTVSLYFRKGKSAISSTGDPDTGPDQHVTLKRGTEAQFNSLCSNR